MNTNDQNSLDDPDPSMEHGPKQQRADSRKKMRETHPDLVMISILEVEGLLGITRKLIYKMENEGSFPPRLNLAHRTVLYRLKDVVAWIELKAMEAERRHQKRAAKNMTDHKPPIRP